MTCAGCGSILSATESTGLAYCEPCAISYRGAAARMELDLANLGATLGQSIGAVSLQHEPSSKEADFFISFSHADAEIAGRLNAILKRRGYSTVFLQAGEGPGANFVREMHEGLKRSRRMILLLSPAYLRSAYGEREWQAFLPKDPDGRKRLLVLFRVAECETEGLLAPLEVIDLVGKKGSALEDAVIRAAACASETGFAAEQPFHYFAPPLQEEKLTVEEDDGRRGQVSIHWIPVTVLLVFMAVLVTVPVAPVVMNADIHLPLRWMLFDGNLRERSTVETDPLPLRYWAGISGGNAELRWNRQWLDLNDLALLRSTAAARDGIAQYTVGFTHGSLSLLSRSSAAGDVAYETRLEYTRPGVLEVLISRREPHRHIAIPHTRTAPVYVGTSTMHDVAVSMKGDLHTLWLNGRSITTFRDALLKQGAVGLSAASRDKVRLYRFSVNMDADPEAAAMSIQPVHWARVASFGDGPLVIP